MFIHVAACIGTYSSLWLNNIPLHGQTTFYVSTDDRSGGVQLWAIVNSAPRNKCHQFLFEPLFSSFGIYLGAELLGHVVILCLIH